MNGNNGNAMNGAQVLKTGGLVYRLQWRCFANYTIHVLDIACHSSFAEECLSIRRLLFWYFSGADSDFFYWFIQVFIYTQCKRKHPRHSGCAQKRSFAEKKKVLSHREVFYQFQQKDWSDDKVEVNEFQLLRFNLKANGVNLKTFGSQ